MKIKQLQFKNICSYGNKIQKIDFPETPQLILIRGENGSGKSTIRDTLDLAVYGNCIKRKNKSLANRINKHGYTYINLETDNKDVEIERGIDPSFKKLYLNGAKQEEASSKNVFDKNIEDLVGIPFNIFTNTISISVEQFKSFISLKAEEKRKIIDKIFNLDMYNQINAKLKEDLSKKKNESQNLQSTIDNNKGILENSYSQLEKLKNEISEQVDTEIKQKQSQIEELSPQLEELNQQITDYQNDIKQIKEKLQQAKDKRSEFNSTINSNNKQLELLKGDKCPYCYSDLNDEKHQEIRDNLTKENQDLTTKIEKLDKKIKELDSDIKNKESELNKINDKKSNVKSSISSLNNEINKLQAKKQDDSQLKSLNETIQNIESKQNEVEEQKNKIDNELARLKELNTILSDEKGVKGAVMDKIVPTLNERIKYYSHHLDSDFDVEFDKHFNASIKIFNEEIDIESLSTGEAKKVNLISALAILETLMMQHNLNILFLDEIFSSLDPNNINKIISILKTLIDKYGLVILTISHMSPPTEDFDQIYEIYQDEDGFSDIYALI